MTDEEFTQFLESVNYSRGERMGDKFLLEVSCGQDGKRTFLDFMCEHPFITFFAFCSAVGSVASIPNTIASTRAAARIAESEVKVAEANAKKATELRKLEELKLGQKAQVVRWNNTIGVLIFA